MRKLGERPFGNIEVRRSRCYYKIPENKLKQTHAFTTATFLYPELCVFHLLKNLGGEKEKKMKWGKNGAVFAIAIAVMLLMATTMVLSSTEPNAEKVN